MFISFASVSYCFVREDYFFIVFRKSPERCDGDWDFEGNDYLYF